MRKIFTLALAAAAVLSVSAQQKAPEFSRTAKAPELSIQAKKAEGIKMQNTADIKHFQAFEKDHMVTRLSRGFQEQLITEAPGTEKFYSIDSEGYYVYLFWITYGTTSAYTNVAFDGDDVYIKDPLVYLGAGTYVRGTLEGDKVTVQLPQCIAFTEYEDPDYGYDYSYTYYLSLMQKEVTEYIDEETGEPAQSITYVKAEENNYVTYTLGEDGSLTLDGMPEVEYDEEGYIVDYPDYILGAYELYVDYVEGDTDEMWAGYGDWAQVLTPSSALDDLVVAPEGMTFDYDWVMSSEDGGMFVGVGFDGNDVYVKGFSTELPDALIKGTLNEDGQYVFPTGQILGYDDYYGVMLYMIGTDAAMEYLTDLVFNYDSRSQRLVSAQDQVIWENGAPDRIYYLYYYTNPKFMYQTADDQNANPADPIFNYYNENYNAYNWTMPLTNIYGYLLDEDRMYFNVLVNGELYTYYIDEVALYDKYTYEYYTEDLTDIPYAAFEYVYMYWYTHTMVEIAFPDEGIDTVGVQVFFQGYDNELYASNLVTYDTVTEEVTTGIESISNDEVSSSVYYNMAGVRVANPTTGIYVKVSTMADGSVRAQKVSIR